MEEEVEEVEGVEEDIKKIIIKKIGTKVLGVIRGRQVEMKVSKMPFVPAKYHKIT